MPKPIHRQEHLILTRLVRDRRKAAGVSQVDLSRLIDRPQSFISDVETGKRKLDLVQTDDICRALGTKLSDLVIEYEAATKKRRQPKSKK